MTHVVSSSRFVLSLLALLIYLVAPAHAQKPPTEALKSLRAADGFDVSLFASEPMITNPSCIDIDTRGRVWVAEIQFYRKNAKQPGQDKIKVLEDTDGDGRADKATVFAEGLFAPMSICVAGSKVYVATSPDLWVYEDKDGDLRADGPPTKLLTGFGGHNHDHGAHSLVLGPDHKWWMAHGDTGFHVKGIDGSEIKFKWGAMLRGELDGSKLEMIAHNFRNPYEICMSSFGESFCSDNDNDGNKSARICWIMEGGDYGWFGGPGMKMGDVPAGTPYGEHWHFRGHIPGHVPATLVTGFGSPCGMTFYEGDAFPKYKNAPLHADNGPREVRIYKHENDGFGKRATSEVFLTSQGDNYFRPDDICTAPDGSLLVSDWYDGGVGGHAYNNPDQGRIYKLAPTGKKLARTEKPGPYNNIDDAMVGLKSPNLATQFLAREKLIAEGQKSMPALSLLANDLKADPNHRARALWLADRIGGEAAENLAVAQLSSKEEAFRALAVRILRRHGGKFMNEIGTSAEKDSSAAVRRELLLALRDFEKPNSGPAADPDRIVNAIVKIAEQYDGSDRYLLEAINIAAGNRKAEVYDRLVKSSTFSMEKFPLLQVLNKDAAGKLLAEKLNSAGIDPATTKALLTAAGTVQSPEAGRGMLSVIANDKTPADLRRLALEKLSSNLSGSWKALVADPQLIDTFKKLLADKSQRAFVLSAIAKHGLTKLNDDVLAIAKSSSDDVPIRQEAIRALATLRADGAAAQLRDLLSDAKQAIQETALSALIEMQDFKTVRDVLIGDKFSQSTRESTAGRLLDSPGGALSMLKLIEDKKLSADLTKLVLAKATTHADSNVRVMYERFIPADQRPQRLGEAIKPELILALKADAKRGAEIFAKSTAAQCKNCHTTDGQANSIGPDLSMIGKKYDRAALLETIMQPSKAISHEYVPYLLETDDGRGYVGFLVEKSDKQVVLKDAKGQLVKVPAKEVDTLTEQKVSLMPELVLRDVPAQDAADLLEYMTTLKQATQSVTRFNILGPFERKQVEQGEILSSSELANPDRTKEYAGANDSKAKWEAIASDGSLGFAGIDTVKYDRKRKLPDDDVVHYFSTYVDSPVEQRVDLLLGSDDGCVVWLNGREVHKYTGSRALAFAEDTVSVDLKKGRNVIVIKVINGNAPGGVSLAVRASESVVLKME